MKALAFVPLLILSACAAKPLPVRVEYEKVFVNVPAPCPETGVGAALIASRPQPLRTTERPSDASVRSGKSQAQLGKYEAEGGWADKVIAALTRCQADTAPKSQ